MQFLVFIFVITILALPALPLPQAIIFAAGVLFILMIGQMLIALILSPLIGLLVKKPQNPEKMSEYYKKRQDMGLPFTKGAVVSILLYTSFQISTYLTIPALVGILLQWYMEKIGERKFKTK